MRVSVVRMPRVFCALRETRSQLLPASVRVVRPAVARRRALVAADFGDYRQQDACEFLERLLGSVRTSELDAARSGDWAGVQLDVPAATQVDRVFGFVQETRWRCTICESGAVDARYAAENVLRARGCDDDRRAVSRVLQATAAQCQVWRVRGGSKSHSAEQDCDGAECFVDPGEAFAGPAAARGSGELLGPARPGSDGISWCRLPCWVISQIWVIPSQRNGTWTLDVLSLLSKPRFLMLLLRRLCRDVCVRSHGPDPLQRLRLFRLRGQVYGGKLRRCDEFGIRPCQRVEDVSRECM